MYEDTAVKPTFGIADYSVFGGVLALSTCVGIYFGCCGTGQKRSEEYLMANRKMSVLPVALSLTCSFVSAVTVLGTPAEVYLYGTQYVVTNLAFILLTFSVSYVYVPVYFNLQVNSAYEYLELRFGKTTRRVVSLLASLHLIVYMAVAVLGPSLVIQQVTGISLSISNAVIFSVCIFYSSIGGLKAVLWTDALQAAVIIGSLLVVVVKGVHDVGGLATVWERQVTSGRAIFFNFNPDPRARHTVWTHLIGSYFTWTPSFTATQAQVQRYMSLPSLKSCRRALWINMLGLILIVTLCIFAGTVLVAKYQSCDPLTTGDVKNSDQLLSYFIVDTSGTTPGLPGLFVAGLTCATLSTVSSCLSALSSILAYDFIKVWFPLVSDERLSFLSKSSCVVSGLVAFGCVFIAEHLGNILPVGSSLMGTIMGPIFGLFTMGMFFPWINTKASLVALISGISAMAIYSIGSLLTAAKKLTLDQRLPLTIDKCEAYNVSNAYKYFPGQTSEKIGFFSQMFSVSFMWLPLIGFLITTSLGLLLSLFCAGKRKQCKLLFSPPILALWYRFAPNLASQFFDPA